ncbi:LysR substrate-binding domain-containing protein [Sedimentitalea arenosa]|uniref:LysR family transcriptional regulator n=1 Tax=Sedimentitalea arenosa TaxID=2798803 RepID=A0A8J7ILY2_9RHOB|nr:LysR substrate-binding domain-containing protein [Arenibacterium arenosum]MBJ6370396.1 LysR family transcriptional regulator [Arenibacterium arenosum]
MSRGASRRVERVLTRLKLKQLRLLVAVARHGSILHAAREMNLSQPAATKMIKDLETDFEVQLFTRTNRGVLPTVFGDSLIRHGKLVFAQIAHAAQELDDLAQGTAGRVVVGTLLAASARVLPMAIDAMLRERPDLVVKVVEGTNEVLMPALRSGELDLVVGRLPTHRHRDDVEQRTLYQERIVAVVRAGHPLDGRTDLTLDDLAELSWILPPAETTLRRQLDQLFATRPESSPRRVVDSVSYLTNRALLLRSELVSVMPSHVAAADLDSGAFARLDWTVPVGTGPVGVSYRRRGALSPAADAFIRTLGEIGATL